MARSKGFDEKVVLKKAMELFWQQGYEKTSMQDLVQHMGIHRKSIYDTFGDKRSLFTASLTNYEKFIVETFNEILSTSKPVKEVIRDIFTFVIQSAELTVYPKGCLTVNAAVELSSIDQEFNQLVTRMFKDTELMFEHLLITGQKNGELNKAIDPYSTSKFLHNNLIGFRVMVKTDYTKKDLESNIDLMMKVLD
ncbi:TetR/AcrR family transcriptional regulator [Alkalicoccobacillus murimartini]|uniref:TetR/AcrR family transcriptional repressor of nem operon n=1 Tax=Alkalicoccobacillus murimartini TaxID=171685 RepID=A0ABT9YJ52_9BACI|nr:TetR/AcrR family transcriptional regulator [Alkalicoccobacillus murimartini]MDQ0207510.1 TetR/AcrR family transcriptional repressor of nem operon [Alkalicoccobacillus murimartini]